MNCFVSEFSRYLCFWGACSMVVFCFTRYILWDVNFGSAIPGRRWSNNIFTDANIGTLSKFFLLSAGVALTLYLY